MQCAWFQINDNDDMKALFLLRLISSAVHMNWLTHNAVVQRRHIAYLSYERVARLLGK